MLSTLTGKFVQKYFSLRKKHLEIIQDCANLFVPLTLGISKMFFSSSMYEKNLDFVSWIMNNLNILYNNNLFAKHLFSEYI